MFGSILGHYPGPSGLWFLVLQVVTGMCSLSMHCMGLKLDQSFIGHSHNVCITFTTENLAGRINYWWKFVCCVGSPIPSLQVLSGYMIWPVQAMYFSLLGILASHPDILLGVSIALGFYLAPELPRIPVFSPNTLLFQTSPTWSLLFPFSWTSTHNIYFSKRDSYILPHWELLVT